MGLWVVPWRFLGMSSLQRMVPALQHPSRYSFLASLVTIKEKIWLVSIAAICIRHDLLSTSGDLTSNTCAIHPACPAWSQMLCPRAKLNIMPFLQI